MIHRFRTIVLLVLAASQFTACKRSPIVSVGSEVIPGMPDHCVIRIETSQGHGRQQVHGAVLVRGEAVKLSASHALLEENEDENGRIHYRDIWSGISESDQRLVFEFVANVKQGYLEAAGKRYPLRDHLVLVLSQEGDKVSPTVLELHPVSFATEDILAALRAAQGRKPHPESIR